MEGFVSLKAPFLGHCVRTAQSVGLLLLPNDLGSVPVKCCDSFRIHTQTGRTARTASCAVGTKKPYPESELKRPECEAITELERSAGKPNRSIHKDTLI